MFCCDRLSLLISWFPEKSPSKSFTVLCPQTLSWSGPRLPVDDGVARGRHRSLPYFSTFARAEPHPFHYIPQRGRGTRCWRGSEDGTSLFTRLIERTNQSSLYLLQLNHHIYWLAFKWTSQRCPDQPWEYYSYFTLARYQVNKTKFFRIFKI